MSEKELSEKQSHIRPFGVSQPEASQAEDSKPSSAGPIRFEKAMKNRPSPSGKPFDARAESKPLGSRLSHDQADELKRQTSLSEDVPAALGESADHSAPASLLAGEKDDVRATPADEKKHSSSSYKAGLARKPDHNNLSALRRRLQVTPTLIATTVVAVALAFALLGFLAGKWVGWNESLALAAREHVDVRPEFNGKIDEALAMLRDGDALKAEAQLAIIERENPDVASLAYLRALAAMQAGDVALAEAKVNESLAKGERVSDSLSLKAVITSQKSSVPGFQMFGDPTVRSEQFLRQAMVADVANPSPLIELGTLLRYKKRDAEAIALLEAAKTRLNPVDSHTVIDVTLALARAEQLADDQLDAGPLTSQDPASLFVAAYVAMRKGQFTSAAQYLRTCRAQLPIDLFDYLVNDPAFRKYAGEPQLASFYK